MEKGAGVVTLSDLWARGTTPKFVFGWHRRVGKSNVVG